VSVTAPAGQRGGGAQELQKVEAIEVVVEQLRAENGPRGRMEDAVGKLATRDARHEPTLALEP